MGGEIFILYRARSRYFGSRDNHEARFAWLVGLKIFRNFFMVKIIRFTQNDAGAKQYAF